MKPITSMFDRRYKYQDRKGFYRPVPNRANKVSAIRQITSVSYLLVSIVKIRKTDANITSRDIEILFRSSLTMSSILDRGGGISWETDCELARLKILDQMAIGFCCVSAEFS